MLSVECNWKLWAPSDGETVRHYTDRCPPSYCMCLPVCHSLCVPRLHNLTWKSVENYPAQTLYDDICNYKCCSELRSNNRTILWFRFLVLDSDWEVSREERRRGGVLVLVDRACSCLERVEWLSGEHWTIISLHHNNTPPRLHSLEAKQNSTQEGLLWQLAGDLW